MKNVKESHGNYIGQDPTPSKKKTSKQQQKNIYWVPIICQFLQILIS